MKKLLLVLIIVLSLTACNSKTSEETATTVTKDTSEMEVEDSSSDQVDEQSQGDSDLLMEISNKRPDNLTIVSTTDSYGTQTKVTTYYGGSNIRYETEFEDMGKSILIYLEDEAIMYSYTEGQSDGMKMINTNSSFKDDMGMMVDNDELVDSIKDESNQEVITRKDTLDGRDVIYVETSSYDDEMSLVLIKMWYSTDYGIPLKYEIEAEGEIIMELNTSIVDDSIIDPALFMPPADINFKEVDMSAMRE